MLLKSIKIDISSLPIIYLLVLSISCNTSDDLPSNQAKGKIIAVTGGCYGEIVLIEVESPLDIGKRDNFSTTDGNIVISYDNAIGIPYFSKIGIPDTIPQAIGTELQFEYRELTKNDKENSLLFSPNPPPICHANIAPPVMTPYSYHKNN